MNFQMEKTHRVLCRVNFKRKHKTWGKSLWKVEIHRDRDKILKTSTEKRSNKQQQVTYKGSEIHMVSDLVTTVDARR